MKPKTNKNKKRKQHWLSGIMLILLLFSICPVQASHSSIIGEKDTTIILFSMPQSINQMINIDENLLLNDYVSSVKQLIRVIGNSVAEIEEQKGITNNECNSLPVDFKPMYSISGRNNTFVDKNRGILLTSKKI